MPRTREEILNQRLKTEGQRVTGAIHSTVYLLGGPVHRLGSACGWGVTPLIAEYGPDHYEAAFSFLRESRGR